MRVDDVLRDSPTGRATLFALLQSKAPDPLEALTIRGRLPAPDIDAIVGHEVKGSTGTKVYTHTTLKKLQKAIEILSYPVLSLPVVFHA